MKQFNQEKVRKIAIDRKDYQQIYVLDHKKRDDIINNLLEMGFKTDNESSLDRYRHLPLVVNTRDLFFFTVGTPSMVACAIQSGASILNYEDMLNLFD